MPYRPWALLLAPFPKFLYNAAVDWITLLQQLINGLSLGSLYALIAIGYTLVYGILRLINFAHGDLLMVAAYVGVMGVGLFSLPWPLAFGLAAALTGLLGVLLERGAYRPLRRAPRIRLCRSRRRTLRLCPRDRPSGSGRIRDGTPVPSPIERCLLGR